MQDKSSLLSQPAGPASACKGSVKGRSGQEQLPRIMGWQVPTMTLWALCITVLTLQSCTDAATVSSRLPKQVTMTAIIRVNQEPLNLDYLSLRWEYQGRHLVEYNKTQVITGDPRASMPQEQFKDGNFSLILANITVNDTGNYTCRFQYGKEQQIIQYVLRVEKNRIQLIDLSSIKIDPLDDQNDPAFRLVKRLTKKSAQESKQSRHGTFLNMAGYSSVTAKTGENVTLMCKFHTDLKMELTMLNIRWSKDGVTKWIFNEEFRHDQAKLEQLSRGHASVNLFSVQEEDSGKYICNIMYLTLERNISTILIVKDDYKGDQYRKEKIGMVVGAVAAVNVLAFFIYFFIAL
ncbi:cell adhesion molecule CEACAM1-like [Pyxicephalus adspersus]|uniref:cell adhesion molecule CEACAM1-like n=1 Tax=Pyxicephalus adspersus TaxID=30357 RepID=UPI003B5B8A4F